MTSDRKKPAAGFWITVALVAVLVYVVSFGPACWIASRTRTDDAKLFAIAYKPMWWAMYRRVPVIHEILWFYAACGMRAGDSLQLPSVGQRPDYPASITINRK